MFQLLVRMLQAGQCQCATKMPPGQLQASPDRLDQRLRCLSTLQIHQQHDRVLLPQAQRQVPAIDRERLFTAQQCKYPLQVVVGRRPA